MHMPTWIIFIQVVVGRRGGFEKMHEIMGLQVVGLELAAPLFQRRFGLAGGHIGVLQCIVQTDHDVVCGFWRCEPHNSQGDV